jgi:hypothetical protein
MAGRSLEEQIGLREQPCISGSAAIHATVINCSSSLLFLISIGVRRDRLRTFGLSAGEVR